MGWVIIHWFELGTLALLSLNLWFVSSAAVRPQPTAIARVMCPWKILLRQIAAEIAVLIDRAVETARAAGSPTEADLLTDVYASY